MSIADLNAPAFRTGDAPPLDASQLVIQFLGNRADFAAAQLQDMFVDFQLADGGNHRRRTAAKRLFQTAILSRLQQLIY